MTHNKPLEPFFFVNLQLKYSMWEFFQQQLCRPFQKLHLNTPQLPVGSITASPQVWKPRAAVTSLSGLYCSEVFWRPPHRWPHFNPPVPQARSPSNETQLLSPLPVVSCTVAYLFVAGVIRTNSAKLNWSFVCHYHKNFMQELIKTCFTCTVTWVSTGNNIQQVIPINSAIDTQE